MIKNKIVFACRWDKIKEKSWSGSKYAIFTELMKRYELEQIDIRDTFSIKGFKALRKLRLIKGEPSLLPIIHKYNRRHRMIGLQEKHVIFQFDEVPWTSETSNYIYQDLAVGYITHMREHDELAYSYCGYANIKKREIEKRQEIQRAYYEHCKGIFCMGNWLAEFLKNDIGIAGEKIHVVGAGINMPINEPDYSKKQGNKILFVGKDFNRKAGELVLKAFDIFRMNYMSTAELYIVGPRDNPIKENITGVFYLGNLVTEDVVRYYEMCDIFCMPSYFEPFGIAFCEALVYGLPCIARNKYAMPEIIKAGEDGYLIDDDNPEELAEKMNLLFSDASMFERVRSKRQYYIDKYSWKNVAERMAQVIDENEGW